MITVTFHNQAGFDDSLLKFAVIAAKYKGKWIFCRHKQRNTWEIPGGRREDGEGVINTAKRELYEETGALDFDIAPVCVYSVVRDQKQPSCGMLFIANVQLIGKLPPAFEIGEITFSEALPEQLTYPQIQSRLFEKANAYQTR